MPAGTSIATRLGWAGLAGWVGLVAVQHLFRSAELPPAERFVSEYARGDGGWVQTLAFFAWAVGLAATAVVVRRVPLAALLAVAALGAVVCGVYETQTVGGELPPGVERTPEGERHDLGSLLIFAGLLLGAVVHAIAARDRRTTLETAGLAALLVLIPGVLIAAGFDAPGIGQRGFILVGCAWQALLLRRVRPRGPRRAG